jgi:hypothetical protein
MAAERQARSTLGSINLNKEISVKYIKLSEVLFREIGEAEMRAWGNAAGRPKLLDAEDSDVLAFLTTKAEAASLAEAQALEREAIDEIIREQFAKEIATKVKEKQAKRQNVK